MRAHLHRLVQDSEGDLQPDITITIYRAGSLDLIDGPIYADDVSLTELSNPFVSSSGIVDCYLDQPQRVQLGIKRGLEEQQFYDNVDILAGAVPEEILVQSPNGSIWVISVDDAGALSVSPA